MQMIRTLDAILLLAIQTKLTASADATRKSDADEAPNLDIIVNPWSQGDDPSHALMSTHMWEFDVGDRVAICIRGDSRLGVQIWEVSQPSAFKGGF